MQKVKLTFDVDKNMIKPIEIMNPVYKEELADLVNKQVEVLYIKYIDPKVREYLSKSSSEGSK